MTDNKDQLNLIISNVAKKIGVWKWAYEKKTFDETIENYFGEITLVSFSGVNECDVINLQLFVKIGPVQHELREHGVVHMLYEREIYMYSKLFEEYNSLHPGFNINELIPKCYYTDATVNSEVIVMENKISEGFQRYTGGRFLNVDHVNVALKSLAQFHALSLIMQEKEQKASNLHRQNLKPLGKEMTGAYTIFLKTSLNKVAKMFTVPRYKEIIAKIMDEFSDVLENETENSNITVFGHGDFWKENILFKYENNEPVKACLIDFQSSRLMNPAFDVLYFLLNSVSSQIRRPFYQEFLLTYHNTLQQVLKENNLNPNIYTKSNFYDDIKRIHPVCFVCVQSSFALWLGVDKGSMLKSKNLCHNEEQRQSRKDELKNIVQDIIDDLQHFGLLEELD